MADAAAPIRSRSNPLFRRFRTLKDKGADELCLIEGPRLLEEALASGIGLVEAAAAPRMEASERGSRLLAALRARGTRVHRMTDGLVATLSEAEASQGLLALARRPTLEEVVRRVRGRGLLVLATAADADVAYDRADLRRPFALLLGREGAGLPDELVRAADQRLAIPMRGPVESLNVGVAAGILLFEAARQRR